MVEVTVKNRRTGEKQTFKVASATIITREGEDLTVCVVGDDEEDEVAVCEALRAAHESVASEAAQTPVH